MIRVATFQTSLNVNSDFGEWNGLTFYTLLETTHNFSGTVAKGIQTNLNLVSDFTYNIIPKRTLITQLSPLSQFSATIMSLDVINTPTEPPAQVPSLIPPDDLPTSIEPGSPYPFQDAGKRAPSVFEIYYKGNLAWLANAPEFGDSNEYKPIRELIRTRGGKLIVITDQGEDNIFDYSFTWLNEIQKITLFSTLRVTLGKKITIVDHLGYTRTGWIITPESEVFEPVPLGFSANFKFQQVS